MRLDSPVDTRNIECKYHATMNTGEADNTDVMYNTIEMVNNDEVLNMDNVYMEDNRIRDADVLENGMIL